MRKKSFWDSLSELQTFWMCFCSLYEKRGGKKQGSASEVTTTGVWGHSQFIWRFTHIATKLTLLDAEATGARRPRRQNRAESDQADKHEKERRRSQPQKKTFTANSTSPSSLCDFLPRRSAADREQRGNGPREVRVRGHQLSRRALLLPRQPLRAR